jgi:hypothetical protein
LLWKAFGNFINYFLPFFTLFIKSIINLCLIIIFSPLILKGYLWNYKRWKFYSLFNWIQYFSNSILRNRKTIILAKYFIILTFNFLFLFLILLFSSNIKLVWYFPIIITYIVILIKWHLIRKLWWSKRIQTWSKIIL